jgi:hypothetical protein
MKGIKTTVIVFLFLVSTLAYFPPSAELEPIELDDQIKSQSNSSPYIIPTFDNYSGDKLNLSKSYLDWNDYTVSTSGSQVPSITYFSERADNTIMILLCPLDNGILVNNETFEGDDSILLNIDRDGGFISAKVLDTGESSSLRHYGFTLFVESPDQTNLTVLGIFPARTSSYSIVNNSITILSRDNSWNYERDVFVALKLDPTTFSVLKHEVVQRPSVIAPQNGPTCVLGLYENTFVNNTEFGIIVELTGNTNSNGANRCNQYDFNGTYLTNPYMSGGKSNFIIRSTHNLDFFDIELVSSKTLPNQNPTVISYIHPPPVFSSEGGWARISYQNSGANQMYFSNYNGSITGMANLCEYGSNSLDLQSDRFNGILHVCVEFDSNLQQHNVSLLRLNLSNGNITKTPFGYGEVDSFGVIVLSSDRIILSLRSNNGFQTNHSTHFGLFSLEMNVTSGAITLADSNLNQKFSSGNNRELTPNYGNERAVYSVNSVLLLQEEGQFGLDRLEIIEIDTDLDGSPDRNDIFPLEKSQYLDLDGDGFGDNQSGHSGDSCVESWGNSTIDRFGCLDVDGDGVSDESDEFPLDETQISDSDSDGFGDNLSGNRGDNCPQEFGESKYDRFGCSDLDGDGYSNDGDDFPEESSQWNDSDDDGFGDEFNGLQGDACPSVDGNSTEDRFGCIDSDGDGWSDDGDDLPQEQTQWKDRDGDGYGENTPGVYPDSFPADGTQWNDSDGDGHGDNPYGTEGDWFPNDVTRWQDSDRDGIANEDDAFPNEVTQWNDSDGDGYGDEGTGNRGDAFPDDENEWTDSDMDGLGNNADAFPFDPTQTEDRDGDGMGDNPMGIGADKFPDDATQWGDIDGDGYGDNPLGNYPDIFITDATQWSDADGDGYGDNPTGRLYDQFPQNPTQWADDDGDGLGDNLNGTDADPYLNDFDNDGYNDSIDILPKLPSPSDLDADGCLDENDVFPSNPQECLDNDGDGEGDNADVDDDNDGWADTDEIRLGTDPFNSAEEPVESFEIVIPGTSVGLGAWDLIGMFGGIPLFVWIGFGFVTRNTRCAKYEAMLREADTREELESVAYKWEYSLMLRMLGPHQGIRLERLRAELDDVFESQNQKLSSIDNHEFDQTQMVVEEMNDTEKQVPELVTQSDYPSIEDTAQKTDDKGYEWFTSEDGTNFYRIIGSQADWVKLEN